MAMAYRGQFVDVGRTSTRNINTLGRKVWTSYAPSTWFHQHCGGIFNYMAKEFLRTQDHVFQYRPSSLAFKILTKNSSMGVISGPALQHIRKICTNELFTFKRIQSFQPMRTKEIRETIKDIYKEANEGKAVDLTLKLTSISTNHMTQMLFKKR
jgi:hypothetical protein